MYIVPVQSSDSVLSKCKETLYRRAQNAVVWAHEENPEPPTFVTSELRYVIEKRFPFWNIVDNWVKQNEEISPLKLFKHGAQSLCSKAEGGVNSSSQARAIMRSPTPSFYWEQKIVSQTLKILAVNAFFS